MNRKLIDVSTLFSNLQRYYARKYDVECCLVSSPSHNIDRQ